MLDVLLKEVVEMTEHLEGKNLCIIMCMFYTSAPIAIKPFCGSRSSDIRAPTCAVVNSAPQYGDNQVLVILSQILDSLLPVAAEQYYGKVDNFICSFLHIIYIARFYSCHEILTQYTVSETFKSLMRNSQLLYIPFFNGPFF